MRKLFILWVTLTLLMLGSLIIEGFGFYDLPDALIISLIIAQTGIFLCLIRFLFGKQSK